MSAYIHCILTLYLFSASLSRAKSTSSLLDDDSPKNGGLSQSSSSIKSGDRSASLENLLDCRPGKKLLFGETILPKIFFCLFFSCLLKVGDWVSKGFVGLRLDFRFKFLKTNHQKTFGTLKLKLSVHVLQTDRQMSA